MTIQSRQIQLRKLLLENLATSQARNPSYSLRAYSKKLGFSPAALSEMMSGKRPITTKTADKIFDRLNVSPSEQEKFKKLERSKKALAKENKNYMEVEMDQYHMISEWFYFAILSLAETLDFSDNPQWISKRLNITQTEAKTALSRLERLQLLKRNTQGHLQATGASFKTTTDIPNGALRKSQANNLELAQASLEQDDISLRDFSSMTMAIDPELLPEAKKLIQDFRRKLTHFLEAETKQEVYKLNIQLFPLTKKDKI